ncbi:50S ribosomal protein L31e, partial [Thermoplasmatales archaeon ex4484_30]
MAEERLYTIPLIKAKSAPRTKRANRAIKEIKKFLMRHMKAEEVKMDNSLNEAVWERGRKNIPTRIRVKAVKED